MRHDTNGLRHAREIEGHLRWLDSFTSAALGVLAVASGIYTYLGVRGLLDDGGALSLFAAVAYSAAVSTAIFVFWSYLMRLLPAMRTAASRLWLVLSMLLGSAAIVAMSSWLNAAALAGSAAVEQHLARTVQDYQLRWSGRTKSRCRVRRYGWMSVVPGRGSRICPRRKPVAGCRALPGAARSSAC